MPPLPESVGGYQLIFPFNRASAALLDERVAGNEAAIVAEVRAELQRARAAAEGGTAGAVAAGGEAGRVEAAGVCGERGCGARSAGGGEWTGERVVEVERRGACAGGMWAGRGGW
jgi:hypothetical protein